MLPRTPALLVAALLLPASSLCAASDWTVTPTGVFQHDYSSYRVSGDVRGEADGARRSRVGLRGRTASGVELRGEWDFASGVFTDLFAELPIGPGKLRVGQYKQPFSLEEQGSSRDLVLLERSLVHDASSLGRRAGVMWAQPLAGLQLQASAFAGNAERLSGSTGMAVRLAQSTDDRLHLGLAVAYERRDDERLRLRARPESRLLPMAPLDLGSFGEVDGNVRIGAEAAFTDGAWSIQSEVFALQAHARSGLDPSGQGAYLQASWLSGGHARSVRGGSVRKPQFESGQWAWELAARIGRVDFDLGRHHLGAQSQLGLGASLYAGRHWQFTLEHSEFRADRAMLAQRAGSYSGRFNSVRAQFSF